MTKKTAHPGNLYLPMEIFVREYDSRLLIAMMAVERGMNVVIGQKWLMEKNIKSMPRGLWIFKTMTLRDSGVMKKVKQAGHCIASIDEEVATFAEGSGDLQWVSEAAVGQCDRIFCIGSEHQKSLAAKWPAHASKTRRTGNPRWDYLRTELSSIYAQQAEKYRSEHGPIILINTNAGESNSAKYRGEKDATQRYIKRGKLDPNSKTHMALWEDYLAFEKSNLKAILSLARSLADKFPSHTVVVRPHPSEEIETYRTAFAGNNRIKVLFEGPAAAWVSASDVLIHTSCTTGIEAYAMGKPAISYETISSAWNTILLPGQLNMKAGSESDVIQLVSRVLADATYWPSFMQGKQAVFHRFFDGSTGPLASENIIEQCSSLLDELNLQDANSGGEWRSRFGFLPWWYLSKNNRRLFPSLNATDVAERIAMLSRRLGRDLHPRVTKIGDRLFKVSAADTSGAGR